MPPGGNLLGPAREQVRQFPRVFVIARHFDRRCRALELQVRGLARGNLRSAGRLLVAGGELARSGVFKQFQGVVGLFPSAKAGRTEKHHRILNLFPAEAGQRLTELGHNADQPPIGTVQELGILIGQRSAGQLGRGISCGIAAFGASWSATASGSREVAETAPCSLFSGPCPSSFISYLLRCRVAS